MDVSMIEMLLLEKRFISQRPNHENCDLNHVVISNSWE
jgi:hypothetical protein